MAYTLGEILDLSTQYLRDRPNVADPVSGAEWLAACLLRVRSRTHLRTRRDQPMPDHLVEAMRRGVKRLATGEPVQYIIRNWDFHGFQFVTDARALIPRPETEQLVDYALQSPAVHGVEAPRFADVGTGTGCIAIALALMCPNCYVLATDVSDEALSLAKENAARHCVQERVSFAKGDLSDLIEPNLLDVVISNPPYIPTGDIERLPPSVRDFEPRVALDGGPDGLSVLRAVAEEASMALRGGGALFLELSAEHNQAEQMRPCLEQLGFEEVRVLNDYLGTNRFITGRLAEGV